MNLRPKEDILIKCVKARDVAKVIRNEIHGVNSGPK